MRLRAVGRTFNPIDGIPHPIPQRNAARPASLNVGEEATPQQERSMRNLWWDGFFAETAEVIWLHFFAVYALALGANIGLIGLLAALSNLMAALSMFPGAWLAEKTKNYKLIVVLLSGGLGRFVFLGMAAIPWIATGHGALALISVLAALRGVLSAIGMPAWQAFAAEFVPLRLRGRYFASRNFARQMAELMTAPLVGLIISVMAGFDGWTTVWLMAFFFGVASTVFYMRIPTTQRDATATAPAQDAATPHVRRVRPDFKQSALSDKRLLALVASSGLFYLAVMMGGPFFSVYLVQELGGNAFWVGVTTAAMPLAGMLSQPFLARLHDRVGPKQMLLLSGAVFPIVPWLWIVATAPWHIFFLNFLAGALWSANLLSALNLLLAIAPEHKRATYAAYHQAAIFFGSFAGPLLGGLLIPLVGFKLVFFLSGAGRGIATLLLWKLVPEDEEAPADEPPEAEREPVIVIPMDDREPEPVPAFALAVAREERSPA